MIQAAALGQAIEAPHTLSDMMDDAVGLLDALPFDSAVRE